MLLPLSYYEESLRVQGPGRKPLYPRGGHTVSGPAVSPTRSLTLLSRPSGSIKNFLIFPTTGPESSNTAEKQPFPSFPSLRLFHQLLHVPPPSYTPQLLRHKCRSHPLLHSAHPVSCWLPGSLVSCAFSLPMPSKPLFLFPLCPPRLSNPPTPCPHTALDCSYLPARPLLACLLQCPLSLRPPGPQTFFPSPPPTWGKPVLQQLLLKQL